MTRYWLGLALALVAVASLGAAPGGDTALAEGIRQAQEGEFDQAVATLSAVARRLAGVRSRVKELTRAHLYLGVAQLGLGNQAQARASFLEVVRLDPALKLPSTEFPPRVVRFFDQVRQTAKPASPSPAVLQPPVPPSPRQTPTPSPSLTPSPDPAPTPATPVATPAPATTPSASPLARPGSADAIDLRAAALATAIKIGRKEGLPGQKPVELVDALRGETTIWFRFRVKNGAKETVKSASWEQGAITTYMSDVADADLRIVIQLPRGGDKGVKGRSKIRLELSCGTYVFPLDSPTISGLLRSLF